MTVITVDAPNDTLLTIDNNAPDARSIMLASASAIASTVIETEGKLSESAKAWGHNLFRAVYVDGMNLDTMIGDSKLAAGWQALTQSDIGKQAKRRLEVYFSNARKVAENWNKLGDDVQKDVLTGLASIHYLANKLTKAAADEKKAADKEAKRIKAEQEAADAKAEIAPVDLSGDDIVPVDAGDAILALTVAVSDMSDADFDSIANDMAALIAAYDKRVAAMADAEIAAKQAA